MWRLARSEAGSVPLAFVMIAAFGAGLFANAALVVGGQVLLASPLTG